MKQLEERRSEMSEIRSQTVREALAGYDMLDNQITILGTHQLTPRHAQPSARHLSRDSLAACCYMWSAVRPSLRPGPDGAGAAAQVRPGAARGRGAEEVQQAIGGESVGRGPQTGGQCCVC